MIKNLDILQQFLCFLKVSVERYEGLHVWYTVGKEHESSKNVPLRYKLRRNKTGAFKQVSISYFARLPFHSMEAAMLPYNSHMEKEMPDFAHRGTVSNISVWEFIILMSLAEAVQKMGVATFFFF